MPMIWFVFRIQRDSDLMRRADVTQSEIFSYRTLDKRIPASRPLRKLRVLVDGILATHANGGYQTLIQNTDFVDLRVGDRLHIDNGGAVRRY
jgi:hypothetical protein